MGERSIARAKLWQANEFAFDKLGKYDTKSEAPPGASGHRGITGTAPRQASAAAGGIWRGKCLSAKRKRHLSVPFSSGRRGQFRLRASAKGWWRRSIARAKLWQANEFAFGKLGQYRAESDHKAERDPRPQASRACPFAEKEEQGSGRMASFLP